MSETKSERIALRVSESQRELLYEASRASASTLSDFVLSAATQAAADVLADRTTFVLPPERWDAFVDLLDRDARPMPRLAAFLARPSILDTD
jgi:uncharacterized protein (DUF1778 family)